MSDYTILSAAEIKQALAVLPDWRYKKPNIVTNYEFKDFVAAMSFLTAVGLLAQRLDHHPDFSCSWNKVALSVCTHAVGHKITDCDIKLARKIAAMAKQLGGKHIRS